MENLASTGQVNLESSASDNGDKPSSTRDTAYFTTDSHLERAGKLNSLFIYEQPNVASGTIEGKSNQIQSHPSPRKITPKFKPLESPRKEVNEDYLQIIRRHYLKIILQSIRKIQSYAKTPDASIYVHKILYSIRDFDEKSPEDPVLEVLFALYDALAYQHQWTNYTSEQFEKAEEIFSKLLKEPIKTKVIEKAIVTLDDIGFDTIPYEFQVEDEE